MIERATLAFVEGVIMVTLKYASGRIVSHVLEDPYRELVIVEEPGKRPILRLSVEGALRPAPSGSSKPT